MSSNPVLTPASAGLITDPPSSDAAAARGRPGRGLWLADFGFSRGRVRVLETGADLALDRTLIGEALVWLAYHLVVRLRSWSLRLVRRETPRIWFTPTVPRPWYLVWAAMAWAGIRVAASPEQADAAFAFEDLTWGAALVPPMLPAFNFGCPDISKSHVADVFGAVFGYPLALDPQTWRGPAVEKGEVNGVHDGRVVHCPMAPLPGRHYQRLIDTGDGDFTYDLRTACVGGAPVAVWIKRKARSDGFSIHNLSVELKTPAEVFSPEELGQIGRFLAVMRIDWAGLDILRDRRDGRIYVVDVNKTDVGPIIALPFLDKIRSTRILAAALSRLCRGA